MGYTGGGIAVVVAERDFSCSESKVKTKPKLLTFAQYGMEC